MNTKTLVTAAALALIGTLAHAEPSALTREQVKADIAAAAANGTLRHTDFDDGASAATRAQRSTLTRAKVLAELARAKTDGTLQHTDFDGYPQLAAARSTLTRAEVNAEVRQAIADGSLPRSDFDFERTAGAVSPAAVGSNPLQRFFAQRARADKSQAGS